MAAALGTMPRQDRIRWGETEGQAARRFRMSLSFYRQLEAGTVLPGWDLYSAIVDHFGWPGCRKHPATVSYDRPD